MSLANILPFELLATLPHYLYSIEDLLSLSETCRALYRACADPAPNDVLRLAATSGRIFFRPHPHILIAFTARQVADWAVQHDDRRYLLELAIQSGVDELLKLALRVAGLTMADIRRLCAYKCDVLNPLNRRLDLEAGPASEDGWTICNDPETTLLSWVIYGELFHHSLELAYLPLPAHKPLSSITRYKWFVYCMPDENSFHYMKFSARWGDAGAPDFFQQYVQAEDDRFQQLSMHHAVEHMLNIYSWEEQLQTTLAFQALPLELCDPYILAVMHMGLKSLEVLVGGPERMEADLNRVASGMAVLHDHTSLLEFIGKASRIINR
ncbi:hypothetical protein B0H17DRAFT_1193570 [Mycena rosella]|uniref:F-box domain-containing protein n=1 Tax=Mycena rosella TaxID=1033263 RepID=A0AAD7GSJ1_MYCRO|nr:hypothetical protein B0H17DRAFT_1193570 [Mycena rosella]